MSEKINGYLYQEYEPAPNKPCEIKTTIFIDTQDMEERYGEELYKEYLEKENKQLKEELQKADSIMQNCLLDGAEKSTINFRECLNALTLYKEVIEEVREYILEYYQRNWHTQSNYKNELLQILDKVKGE